MQPYFKSMHGAIVPFSSVLAMTADTANRYNITLLSSAEVPRFTFNDLIDHDEQIKNYETWLVDQYHMSQ